MTGGPWTHRRRAVASLLALALGSGCQWTPDLQRPGTAPSNRNYADPIVVSNLRERALATIQEASLSRHAEVRANAVEAAARAKNRLAPVIAAGLKDGNQGVRSVAAMSVGRAGLKELAPNLQPLLHDPSPYVQAAAILGLSLCDVSVDPSPLASILLLNPSPKVRAHAAFVLGELGNRSAVGLLHTGAKVSMPGESTLEVRLLQLQISEALVKLGESDSLQALRAALYPARPEDLEATALAVQIIGQVRDRGAIDQLIYLAATQDRSGQHVPAEIRLAVAAALARMGLRQGSFIADEYWSNSAPALRAQSAFVYGETGDAGAMDKLEALLADEDWRVKVAAAAAVLQLLESGAAGIQQG